MRLRGLEALRGVEETGAEPRGAICLGGERNEISVRVTERRAFAQMNCDRRLTFVETRCLHLQTRSPKACPCPESRKRWHELNSNSSGLSMMLRNNSYK